MKELANGDPSAYQYGLNIITGKLDEILETVKLKIKKGLMVMRLATPTRTKIEAARQYLAVGDIFKLLEYAYSPNPIKQINFL